MPVYSGIILVSGSLKSVDSKVLRSWTNIVFDKMKSDIQSILDLSYADIDAHHEVAAALSWDFTEADYIKASEYKKSSENEVTHQVQRQMLVLMLVFVFFFPIVLMWDYIKWAFKIRDSISVWAWLSIACAVTMPIVVLLGRFVVRIRTNRKLERIPSQSKEERIKMYAQITAEEEFGHQVLEKNKFP